MKDGKPLVNLQVYEPQKPRPPRKKVDPSLFVPLPTSHPYYPPQYNYQMAPFLYHPQQVPIIKNYDIQVGGPVTDHTRVSMIYEDVLPSNQFANTYNSLGERLNIYNFVRSVFIKEGDGEDIDIAGKKQHSLLSYLKFMELNPYNTTWWTLNPYKGLPKDMLIYKSCYPMRYNKRGGGTECANNSVGINIRIYKLNNAEYKIKEQENDDYYNYNVWRELAYYEYIREQILKQKICPNFPLLYSYYICQDCDIDFDKISRLRGEQPMPQKQFLTEIKHEMDDSKYKNLKIFDYKKKMKGGSSKGGGNGHIDVTLNTAIEPKCGYPPLVIDPNHPTRKPYVPISSLPKKEPRVIIKENPEAFSGRGLILLTEAPNYNIYGWASRTYEMEGNVKRMISTGYHKSEVWKSVLFQIAAALYVLQKNSIAFYDFSAQDNVYIKDIKTHGNITSYWKYIIDGIEYYIPNYGYLVIIDSNFKDTETKNYTMSKVRKNNRKYKLYSNIYHADGGSLHSIADVKKLSFKSFTKVLNPNTFSKSFTNSGGTKIPDEVKDFLTDVHSEASTDTNHDIGKYIYGHMKFFMNNRIGTLLKENEVKHVKKHSHGEFKKGQICCYQESFNKVLFVLFLDQKDSNVTIVTKNNPLDKDYIEKDVSFGNIFHYSKYEKIVQNFKANKVNLNEEELLETYII